MNLERFYINANKYYCVFGVLQCKTQMQVKDINTKLVRGI
jgi:hypothetical protein